jgi:hypothetical protein
MTTIDQSLMFIAGTRWRGAPDSPSLLLETASHTAGGAWRAAWYSQRAGAETLEQTRARLEADGFVLVFGTYRGATRP